MARSVEATGKNVAEATAKALRELGVAAGQADITVISRGRPRLFGLLRGAPAKVRVVHKASMRDRAESLLSDLLRHMRFSTQLDVQEQKHGLYVNIESAGTDALLIGQGGVTLSSLEYLVNRLLQQDDVKGYHVMLDVGGYRRRHGHELQGEQPPPRGRRPRGGRGRRDGAAQTREPAAQPVGAPAGGGQPRAGGRRRSGRGRRRRGPGGRGKGQPGGGQPSQQ